MILELQEMVHGFDFAKPPRRTFAPNIEADDETRPSSSGFLRDTAPLWPSELV